MPVLVTFSLKDRFVYIHVLLYVRTGRNLDMNAACQADYNDVT